MTKRLQLPYPQRYLIAFRPKSLTHAFADVLIIGSGIAGCRAALEIDRRLDVIIVTKDEPPQSSSSYAQGGIASVLGPEDAFSDHAADTIAAGKGLCDPAVVEMVVREAPERIRELIQWGARFDTRDGQLLLTQEGGHSHPRIVHALGDATGREVMRALLEAVRQAPSVQIRPRTFTIDLLTHEGVCRGALVWHPSRGVTAIWAKQTILATGGAGRLYRETTNPEVATGDGQAIGFRAGAELRDMEFMQFHPTVLYIAGGSRHLISEAVRGEGAYLVDCHGVRFMQEYDPAAELAPRDVVARAITDRMAQTHHPCVYLDLRHLDREFVYRRFPNIRQVCEEFGLDIARDLIPVRPGAHYMIGGLTIDTEGRTTLPGLWAAGEATSSGLHGANRLGSNSLLEGLVFGRRAGRGASEAAAGLPDELRIMPIESDDMAPEREQDELNLSDLRNSLTSLMWRRVGIVRDARGLADAQAQVEFWNRYVSVRQFADPFGWELQNMLLTARLMIAAAAERKETRGVHCRSDFPETDPAQAQHICMTASSPASEDDSPKA